MKKLFAMVLTLAMALSLVACGGGAEEAPAPEAEGEKAPVTESAEPTKLTLILRGGTYGDVIKAALPAFEAENNVKCEVLDLSFDDLHNKIALDAVNKNGAYDLCMVDGSWMAEFTENGVLANLSELGYEFDEDIIPATTDICVVDGDIYLAPYFGNVTVMLYNKALIEAAGYAPADIDTFEDLMDIAKKTNAGGNMGFLIRGGSGDNIVSDFIPHLLAYGGWVVDDNNQPTVNTPEFKAAFENYIELYKLGDTLDKDMVVKVIKGVFKEKSDIVPTAEVIIDEVCKFYNIEPTILRGQGRAKDISLARQIAMYLIRSMTNLSLKEIGKEFDNRDHTTVLHSIERVEELSKSDPEKAEIIKDITANINIRYE